MSKLLLFLLFLTSFQLNSTETQRFDEEINPFKPNYTLLDAGLLRAANEVREAYGLAPLIKNELLQKVAESHANNMIEQNFYNHKNPYLSNQRSLTDRVQYFANNQNPFKSIGENIANYDILDSPSRFCVKKLINGKYYFFDCNSQNRMPILTYKGLAKLVVKGWLESESHRENLLDPNFKYLGTSARLSHNPYASNRPPFARLVQNFGG